MKTPVLLLVFNRPDLTEKVFNRIAEAKPEKLFLVSDGPREGNADDEKSNAEVKKVLENVTWDCEVHRNYSDKNLGCGIRVASGISWVFEHVDRAIILEDDCLPDPTFFRFCDELLERYKDDRRIMNISGKNLQYEHVNARDSYFFSRYPVTWGWATWRRAWNYYDYHLTLWNQLKETDFPLQVTKYENTAEYLRHHFNNAFRKDSPADIYSSDYIYTWDYQWVFACWAQKGFSIVPDRNLVSNVGFGDENHEFAAMPVSRMEFPLKHPNHKIVHSKADNLHFKKMSSSLNNIGKKKASLTLRTRNRLIRLLRDFNLLPSKSLLPFKSQNT